MIADCTEKLWLQCNGWGHTADVCSTATEMAVLAVKSKVGARDDEGEGRAAQASALKTEKTGECHDIRMEDG